MGQKDHLFGINQFFYYLYFVFMKLTIIMAFSGVKVYALKKDQVYGFFEKFTFPLDS